jgi:tRNA G18 (ribose-2'-O)-methylase SpoU
LPLIRIDDLSCPRLDPYRNLRTTNLTRVSGRFIAESRPLVARLLASPLRIESVLLDEAFCDEAADWISPDIDVYVVPSLWVSELIGFQFHRGYLACGKRPVVETVDQFLESTRANGVERAWTGVLMEGVQDPENMGSLLRTCAALGIENIFLGPSCVDPFARRVLRVSMGNAFQLRFHAVSNPLLFLSQLRATGIESIATCFASDSEEIRTFRRRGPCLVMFGNEAHGLKAATQNQADRRLMISMDLATDSLNVSVAGGIILHNLCRIC